MQRKYLLIFSFLLALSLIWPSGLQAVDFWSSRNQRQSLSEQQEKVEGSAGKSEESGVRENAWQQNFRDLQTLKQHGVRNQEELKAKFKIMLSQAINRAIEIANRMQMTIENAQSFSRGEKQEVLRRLEDIKTELTQLQQKLRDQNLQPSELRQMGQRVRQTVHILRELRRRYHQKIIAARLQEVVNRLRIIVGRIQSALSSLGIDDSTLKSYLDRARSYLSEAQNALDRKDYQAAKSFLLRFKQQIRQFRQALQDLRTKS